MADEVKAGIARMFDDLSASYDTIVPLHTYFGERLVAAAGVAEGDRVLDVGTGLGACLVPAASRVGDPGAVVGIDISPEMIEKLTRSIEAARVRNVEARLMDAEALEFGNGQFDVVTCAFVLFFFPDRMRALSEFARVLRPGGTIAISTFANNTLGYPWIGEVVAPFLPQDAGRPDVAQQFLRVDETQLHAQLQQVGFEAPVSEIVEGQFRFASPEQHWGWLMTTGYRFAIQRVDPTQIDRLKAVLAQRLEQHWNGDGYQFDRPTRFTLARRGL